LLKQWLASGLGLALLVTGCAQDLNESYVRSCVVFQDQTGTFDGKWKVAPVPLAVEAGKFSEFEKSTIRMAVQQWNKFAQAVYHQPILDVGASGVPEVSATRSGQICASNQPMMVGNQFVSRVVIYKHSAWPYSTAEAIAITSTCPVQATPLNQFYDGMIELNYRDFFVSGKRVPDLQSIIVHELGHLLGLRHSCEASTTREGVPICTDPGINSTYKDAVMFPVFGFDSAGQGEKRFKPNSNDQGRMNCLYL